MVGVLSNEPWTGADPLQAGQTDLLWPARCLVIKILQETMNNEKTPA